MTQKIKEICEKIWNKRDTIFFIEGTSYYIRDFEKMIERAIKTLRDQRRITLISSVAQLTELEEHEQITFFNVNSYYLSLFGDGHVVEICDFNDLYNFCCYIHLFDEFYTLN